MTDGLLNRSPLRFKTFGCRSWSNFLMADENTLDGRIWRTFKSIEFRRDQVDELTTVRTIVTETWCSHRPKCRWNTQNTCKNKTAVSDKIRNENQTKIVKTKCCSFCVAETSSGTWKQRAAAFGCCLSGLNASRCSAHRHNRTRPQTDADWAGCWTWTAAWDPVLPPLNSSASIGCTPVRNGRTCPSAPAHLYPAPSSRCTHGHTLRLIFPRLRPTVKTCVNVSSAYDIFTFPAENLVRFLFFFLREFRNFRWISAFDVCACVSFVLFLRKNVFGFHRPSEQQKWRNLLALTCWSSAAGLFISNVDAIFLWRSHKIRCSIASEICHLAATFLHLSLKDNYADWKDKVLTFVEIQSTESDNFTSKNLATGCVCASRCASNGHKMAAETQTPSIRHSPRQRWNKVEGGQHRASIDEDIKQSDPKKRECCQRHYDHF